MDIEDLKTMLTYLCTFGVGAVFGIFLTFFHEKAKNFAIMQDIGRITEQIENVKQQNNLVLEEVRGRHQLRLAALDRRLKAHQEAFMLWRRLLLHIQDTKNTDIEKAVTDCQNWWDENCIYLNPEARKAFKTAYHIAYDYKRLLSNPGLHATLIADYGKQIYDAGDAIVKGAELPPLDEESKILNNG
jgi:hypothetical protein